MNGHNLIIYMFNVQTHTYILPNFYNYLSNAQTFLKDCSSLLIQDASNAPRGAKTVFNNNKLIQQYPLGL